jgi:hypothetical protein
MARSSSKSRCPLPRDETQWRNKKSTSCEGAFIQQLTAGLGLSVHFLDVRP